MIAASGSVTVPVLMTVMTVEFRLLLVKQCFRRVTELSCSVEVIMHGDLVYK